VLELVRSGVSVKVLVMIGVIVGDGVRVLVTNEKGDVGVMEEVNEGVKLIDGETVIVEVDERVGGNVVIDVFVVGIV